MLAFFRHIFCQILVSVKYSMQENKNNTWQEFLNKNYKPTGIRTNLEDIRLLVIENKKQGIDEKNKYSNLQ